jgi:hypothetical protein
MRVHFGTLMAGIVYLAIGLAFVAEAVGWWTLQVGDLRYLGPLALVVVGIAVVVGSLSRRDADDG